ncbi:amino acid permease [Schumannella luteola]|uniref:APA family basic amino acid/polyamine antiporter n=1 Tax=Schumannella luteola TaxID=472059 RepID=A0A852Y9L2_9MICO|nr:amino acid permease [Schumannella luteola]NYG97901.1 APA family basic amino acid/polyamine antiporter [Schumannella luteola]TPX03044.1 amino acid permease [Schumannella luteola]
MAWRVKSVEASVADSDDGERSLKRSLGTWDLALMGVAVAVGAGIFSVGAQAAASFAGPSVIISFVLAAITCGLAIMCYAEFASTVPVAGSAYTFTYATLGEPIAWIIAWDLILEMFTAAAVLAKYWGVYLAEALKSIGLPFASTFKIGDLEVSWPAFVVVAVFTALLALGTKLTTRVGAVFTVIKVAIVIFVIVVGFFFVKAANYSPFIPPAKPTEGGSGDVWTQSLFSFVSGSAPAQYGVFGLLAAASLVFFAFIGFDVVATSAEEVKKPQRTLPRGIFLGLGIVSLLYVLVSIVLTGMVPYTELAKSDAPSLATAFQLVGQPWAAAVISFGALAGLTTVIMVLLLGLSRIVFALSRDGLLPRWLSKTSSRKTPVRTIVIGGALVALTAAFFDVGLLEEMINIGTLSAFVLVSIAVIVLRRTRPDLTRGFRVPLSPVLPILSAALCLWLMFNLTTLTWVRFLIWLVVGLVVYVLYGRRKSRVGAELRAAGLRAEASPKLD